MSEKSDQPNTDTPSTAGGVVFRTAKLIGKKYETSSAGQNLAIVFEADSPLEIYLPGNSTDQTLAVNKSCQFEIPYCVDPLPEDSSYEISFEVTYEVNLTDGAHVSMLIDADGVTSVLEFPFDQPTNIPLKNVFLTRDFKAPQGLTTSSLIGICILGQRRTVTDSLIFIVDNIDIKVRVKT
jgi:hypothetical protein